RASSLPKKQKAPLEGPTTRSNIASMTRRRKLARVPGRTTWSWADWSLSTFDVLYFNHGQLIYERTISGERRRASSRLHLRLERAQSKGPPRTSGVLAPRRDPPRRPAEPQRRGPVDRGYATLSALDGRAQDRAREPRPPGARQAPLRRRPHTLHGGPFVQARDPP